MNLKKYKGVSQFSSCAVLAVLLFQNCSKVSVSDLGQEPSLAAAQSTPDLPSDLPTTPTTTLPSLQPQIAIAASPSNVVEGQESIVSVSFQDLENVSYLCTDRVSKEILAAGAIKASGQSLKIKIDRDIRCEAMGNLIGSKEQRSASQDLTVNCANRIKNMAQNKCQDFSCQKITELSSLNDLLHIPARNSEGICYAIKLLSKIANSDSSLTREIDSEVISRNHDSSGPRQHNPYSMGAVKAEFQIEGPRVIKLSGGLSPSSPILVDNFVLMGVYPSANDVSASLRSVYKALGTSDSSINDANGVDTNSVQLKDALIPVASYASGGTSSVTAIDITHSVEPMTKQTLDIRALDCGGRRELSDVYLLFQ